MPLNHIDSTCSAVHKQSPSHQMGPITHQVIQHDTKFAQWATQFSISGNMIKQKICKLCVDNYQTIF